MATGKRGPLTDKSKEGEVRQRSCHWAASICIPDIRTYVAKWPERSAAQAGALIVWVHGYILMFDQCFKNGPGREEAENGYTPARHYNSESGVRLPCRLPNLGRYRVGSTFLIPSLSRYSPNTLILDE
jgi:hypothetical protein